MAEAPDQPEPPLIIGRYEVHQEIARGGMATVHLGRIRSDAGFSRTVAIKRLHRHLANDAGFAAMFVDEARLASRIHHPNVVATLDVVLAADELFLVMEYVQGESLSRLSHLCDTRGTLVPIEFVVAVVAGALDGLHAAHEAVTELDEPLGIVHRDVSPQNILVGVDGVPRIIDFGVAKAAQRLQTTREGQLKGKLRYLPPEQFAGAAPDRRSDIYAAGIVLWEALTSERLFDGSTDAETVGKILRGAAEPPSVHVHYIPPALDDVVMCALAVDPAKRFSTARQMALALEAAVAPAPTRRIGEWVRDLAATSLGERARHVHEIESGPSGFDLRPGPRDPGDSDADGAGPPSQSRTFVPRRHSIHDIANTWVEPESETIGAGPPSPARAFVPRRHSIHDIANTWVESESETMVRLTEDGDETIDMGRQAPLVTPPEPPAWSPGPSRREMPTLPPMGTPGPAPAPLFVPIPAAPARPTRAATPPNAATPPKTEMGTAWREDWDGTGWNVVYRPLSVLIPWLFAVFVLLVAGVILSQAGTDAIFGVVAGVGLSGLVVLRMLRSTYFRVERAGVLLETRPIGPSKTYGAEQIQRFAVIDEGPARVPNLFSVHVVLRSGDVQRLDVAFGSDAEARFVANRLNEMMVEAGRGGPSARVGPSSAPRPLT
jgi:serine/threonine-protein kinase